MSGNQQTIERLASILHRPQGGDNMPAILCKRFVPHKRTYRLWDASWEGLKPKRKGGKILWEIHSDFNMPIEMDGLCLIPDTPNNRKRLEKISKPVTVTLDKDPVTGIAYIPPKEVTHQPLYQRADTSMMERGLIDRLLDAMEERKSERNTEGSAPIGYDEGQNLTGQEEGDEGLLDETGEPLVAMAPPLPVAKPKGARGRPRKPDPLLSPLRGGNDRR